MLTDKLQTNLASVLCKSQNSPLHFKLSCLTFFHYQLQKMNLQLCPLENPNNCHIGGSLKLLHSLFKR